MRAALSLTVLMLLAAPASAQPDEQPAEAPSEQDALPGEVPPVPAPAAAPDAETPAGQRSEADGDAQKTQDAAAAGGEAASGAEAPAADTAPPPAPAQRSEESEAPPAPTDPDAPGVAPAPLVIASPSDTPAPPGVIGMQPEEDQDGPSIPWSLTLSWDQGYNAAGFDRGGQQSFNPEYAWGFGFAFRWNFEDTGLRFDWVQELAVELTDSDSTVSRQELQLADSRLVLSRPFEFELAADRRWSLSPSVGLVAPISKASQAADVIIGTRLGVQAGYAYDAWLEGFSVSTSFSHTRRWASTNVPSAERAYPCLPAGREASLDCVHLGTSTTSRDLFVLLFSAGLDITERLSAGAAFSLGWTLSHPLEDLVYETDDGSTRTFGDDETHWRTSRIISADVGYNFLPWLSTGLFMRNTFAELGPDGQRRAAFEPVDTVVGTELSISIDQLYLGKLGNAD